MHSVTTNMLKEYTQYIRLLCINYGDLRYRFVNTTTKLIDRSYYIYDDYLYICRGPDTIETSVFKIQNC